MDLLELRYSDSGVRHDRSARRIAFEIVGVGTWCFDPRAPGRLFARREADEAALRLRCSAQTLLALITKPSDQLPSSGSVSWQGDLNALTPLLAASPVDLITTQAQALSGRHG
jgi:hypothetical protein